MLIISFVISENMKDIKYLTSFLAPSYQNGTLRKIVMMVLSEEISEIKNCDY